MTKRLSGSGILFLINCFFTGCPYTLSENPPVGLELFVEVHNESFGLLMGPLIDHEIRKIIVKSSSYSLTSVSHTADLKLYLTVSGYRDTPESYDPDDSFLASAFALVSTVKLKWESASGDILLEEIINSDASVLRPTLSSVSLASSSPVDEQARQTLAESIAKEVYFSMRKLNSLASEKK